MKSFNPGYVVHPSETVKEIMEEKDISPTELAIECGLPIDVIRFFLAGKINLSKYMAEQFSISLGSTPEFWLKLATDFEAGVKAGNEWVK